MKELLKKLRALEAEMEEAENQSEYWMEEEHLDMEKSNSYEAEADRMVKIGYCTYPVVKLDIEKIGEYLEVA